MDHVYDDLVESMAKTTIIQDENVDMFAQQQLVKPAEPVEVNIKSTGEIVSSMFESRFTMQEEEQAAIRIIDHGDLDAVERKEQPFRERCFTADKHNIAQTYSKAFTGNADHFMILGTNGSTSYALVSTSPAIVEYKSALLKLECASVYHSLAHDVRNLQLKKDAEALLSKVTSMSKIDPNLRPAIAKIAKELTAKLKELPETLPDDVDYTPIVVSKRPGGKFPTVQFMVTDFYRGDIELKTAEELKQMDEEEAKLTKQQQQPVATAAVAAETTVTTKPTVRKAMIAKKQQREEPPKPVPVTVTTPPNVFSIWSCDATKPDCEWKPCTMPTFEVKHMTIPSVAFNKTHMVVIFQPRNLVDEDLIIIHAFELDRRRNKLIDTFAYKFDNKYFGSKGLLVTHLSDQNILSLSFTAGTFVFDILRQVKRPRLIVLESEKPIYRRNITCCKVCHLPDNKRPDVDDWDSKFIVENVPDDGERPVLNVEKKDETASVTANEPTNAPIITEMPEEEFGKKEDTKVDVKADTTADTNIEFGTDEQQDERAKQQRLEQQAAAAADNKTKVVDPPLWSGLLVIGTAMGESFGINWRNGVVEFGEVVPAIESIFNATYSNKRIIMQTALAICAKFLPYMSEQLTNLPTSRPLGIAVCGTLLFSLEKYGAVQVFSTTARRILFPFKIPRDLETGCKGLFQHTYQGVYAGPDRVVVVYPNGLTRCFDIRTRIKGMIEDRVHNQKKVLQKQAKKMKKINEKK